MADKWFASPIPDGWSNTTLGSVVEKGGGHIQTGPFGSQLHASDYVPIGLPSIMPANIGDNRILEEGIARITEADAKRLSRHRVKAGDIIYSRRGDVERRALIRLEQEGWLCGTGCLKVRFGDAGIDPAFVSYYLGHPAVRSWIVQHAIGATMPNLNTSIMKAVPLLVPPLKEQQAIAHILAALDDKIDLNRRMNQTLEEMAQAIFKSWFVDFDPVRAKAVGKQPARLAPHIADLFPDGFEESELGEIPKEWSVSALGNVCEVIDCLHSKKPERRSWGLPLLQLNNIRDDGLIDVNDTYFIDVSDYAQWISRMEASPGDCVITNVGRVGAVAQIPQGLIAALGRNMTGVRCKADFPFPTFILECLLSDAMKTEILRNVDSGTILDALNVRSIPKLRFVRAPNKLLEHFEHVTRPLRARMEEALAESRTLAALRDTLLPKLISGELRVPDAGKLLEAAL